MSKAATQPVQVPAIISRMGPPASQGLPDLVEYWQVDGTWSRDRLGAHLFADIDEASTEVEGLDKEGWLWVTAVVVSHGDPLRNARAQAAVLERKDWHAGKVNCGVE